MVQVTPDAGSYLLISRLDKPAFLRVGALGEYLFPSGIYFYSGSAGNRGGLRARIFHHLCIHAFPHWHLDYLRPFLHPLEAWMMMANESLECDFNCYVCSFFHTKQAVKGFGSSDCRRGCGSHLSYLPLECQLDHLFIQFKEYFKGVERIFL